MRALRAFLTTVLLLGCTLAGSTTWAEPPTGSLTNQIVGLTNSLWDIKPLFTDLTSDSWAGDLSVFAARATNDAYSIGFNAPYDFNGRGQLSGKGTNTLSLSQLSMFSTVYSNWVTKVITNTDETTYSTNVPVLTTNWSWGELTNFGSFPGAYTAHGSVIGAHGSALVRFVAQESSQVPLSGATYRLSATKGFYLLCSTNRFSESGSDANIIRFSGKPSYQGGSRWMPINPFYTYLDGGTWSLVLNFDAPSDINTTKLSGDASVTLSSGNVYPFHFTGRYSPKTHLSALQLTGVQGTTNTQDGRGAHLSVTLTNSDLLRLFGRVAGQPVNQK